MINKIKTLLLFIPLIILSVSGCKKEDPQPEVTAAIAIDKPLENAVIEYNQLMSISGEINVSEGVIQGYEIYLRNTADKSELLAQKYHEEMSGKITFTESWKNELHHTATLELEVIVLLDAAGKTTSKKINITAKEEEEVADPVIIITNPQDGAMIHPDETVDITGSATWSKTLHGYKIIIRNKADQTEIFTSDDHIHGTEIQFATSWKNELHEHTDLELEVIIYTDHDGGLVSRKIDIHAHGRD